MTKPKNYRPDFSDYLAHFTSSENPLGKNPTDSLVSQATKAHKTAKERLINILTERKICSSMMPWTGTKAVCLTECPWSSLIDHTKQYSPYGIGFSKNFIFSRDGSPVYYVRADQYDKQQWHDDLKAFVTPFWPSYRPQKLSASASTKIISTVDYTHEREWRVPHDLKFGYSQIEFVVLNTYEDMAEFPKELKDALGRSKFLLMENYKTIERLWPVHNIDL